MLGLPQVAQVLRQLKTRVDGMVVRGVVEYVNDALKTQRVQVTLLADEPLDDVEHLQPYGLSFVPPAGAQCLALAVGGARAHVVALAADVPGERPTGAGPREGGLYTKGKWRVFVDDEGNVCVGDKESDQRIPLGDALLEAFNKHVHMTPNGLSDPPNALTKLTDAVLSKHKVAP